MISKEIITKMKQTRAINLQEPVEKSYRNIGKTTNFIALSFYCIMGAQILFLPAVLYAALGVTTFLPLQA